MNILSAIYAGNRGILKGLQASNRSAQVLGRKPEAEELVKIELEELQVKASSKVVRVSDELLRELNHLQSKT